MQILDQEINFSDYLNIIKRRKKVVLIFFFTVVGVVTLGSFLMKPVYRATATLLIDLESPNVLAAGSGEKVSLGSPSYLTYKEYFQSQTEIIQSRSIMRQVFDEFDLKQKKEYKDIRNPIEKFLKTVKVEPVRDTRLLLLHVENSDPALARDLANRIAIIYVDRNLSYITKSEVMNLHKNEYLRLQAKLSEYEKIYKDKHPKMIRLKEEIRQTIENIQKEQERVKAFDFSQDVPNQEASTLVLAGLKANNISIQDYAETPALPYKPKKRLNILMAILIGMFGGIILAFFFEHLDDSVKDVDEVLRLVNWPYLGSIPDFNYSQDVPEEKKEVLVALRPMDPLSEAYRSIRTSMLFSFTKEYPLSSLILTSAGPQEGKTTTICNLAISLAKNGKKVLLIDADMRKSRLHKIFKIKNDVGLSNYLCDQADEKKIIKETDTENLFLVVSGPHPPNPSELLSTSRLEEFVDKQKKEFDFLLFDTPPIAVVTDAAILSKAADGIVLVVESGKTLKKILPTIDFTLKNAQARIIGFIMNRISKTSSNYYYYASYYGKKGT